MRKYRLHIVLILAIAMVVSNCNDKSQAGETAGDTTHIATDPLPSWNDGELKNAIIAYVKKITDSNSSEFIPIEYRSEERRVGKECRSLCDWSSDVCSSDLDPLPSWNDGELKNAIIAYVKKITDSNSSEFIPIEY